MFDLIDCDPCPAAYSADPMSAIEIDSHPDAARIWATVEAMKASMKAEIDDYEAVTSQGYDDDIATAEEHATDAAKTDVRCIIDNHEGDDMERLLRDWCDQ